MKSAWSDAKKTQRKAGLNLLSAVTHRELALQSEHTKSRASCAAVLSDRTDTSNRRCLRHSRGLYRDPVKLPNSSRFNKCPTATTCFRLTPASQATTDHSDAVTQQGRIKEELSVSDWSLPTRATRNPLRRVFFCRIATRPGLAPGPAAFSSPKSGPVCGFRPANTAGAGRPRCLPPQRRAPPRPAAGDRARSQDA